ncbi:class II aldolase/adducin family protein [Pseudonocardia sulfidoxydans NBRC 16205]|uniref:Class II aldolase/adducin family protein n=1 Tax=Pseudonocardia sulfidoxydans NBRC 16205 TaxID=1223511 RepID=A0A511D8Q7_9PSEU|nr:class II aldolase/adducin family protein [Pseudonocardia sulfidoxydans]GEL21189.1 class II aldolase/adducin family protein [Pseudonocardia sulfidoxydans NBRC 16205]
MTTTAHVLVHDSDSELVAERERRKVALAATLRLFAKLGYEFGFNGHLTVRDPASDDLFWANPWKVPFGRVRVSDLLLVSASDDPAGRVVQGAADAAVSGFAGQHILHSAREDAVAVVHVHSPAGFTWASQPQVLDPLTTDSALIHGLQAVHEDFGLTGEGHRTTADSLGPTAKILVQRGHGFITIGRSLEEAAFYFIAAERAAHQQLQLEAAGRGERIDDSLLAKWALTPDLAEQHYFPHLQQVLHDEVDMLL